MPSPISPISPPCLCAAKSQDLAKMFVVTVFCFPQPLFFFVLGVPTARVSRRFLVVCLLNNRRWRFSVKEKRWVKVNGKKWPRREVAFEFELGCGTKMMEKKNEAD